MKAEIHKYLKDYQRDFETRRDLAYNQLISASTRGQRQDACRKMARFTALRRPDFVKELERLKGLRND